MPIHTLSCSTTASGLHNLDLIIQSLEWLCDKKEVVKLEKTTSFHGSPITLLTIKLSRSQSRLTLSRLGENVLRVLINEKNERLDDENRLHFRLSQNELVRGKIRLANSNEDIIKMTAKIEVYPGEKPQEVLLKLLTESLERCTRRGWLESPPLDL